MTEEEYVNVYNLALIRTSLDNLVDVCGGALSQDDMNAIHNARAILWRLADKLHHTLDPVDE